jgi:hypothetical protein
MVTLCYNQSSFVRGKFSSCSQRGRLCDLSRDPGQPEPQLGSVSRIFGWARGSSGGLVVAGGVEDQVAEEFAGDGVDDADVVVAG